MSLKDQNVLISSCNDTSDVSSSDIDALDEKPIFRTRKKVNSQFKKIRGNSIDKDVVSMPATYPLKKLKMASSVSEDQEVEREDLVNTIIYPSTGADRYEVKNQFTGVSHQEQEEVGKDAVSAYEERVEIWKRNRKPLACKTTAETRGASAVLDENATLYRGKKNMNVLCLEQFSGPQRVSTSHIRMSSVIDYARDVCKDYKETGYCGYGDNCKFLHDRTEYKSGWELDREWEQCQEEKRKALLRRMYGEDESEEKKDSDQMPFACHICRKNFVNPVMTKCNHYFCEECALDHFKTSKLCAICSEPTMGIFNVAINIIKKQQRQEEKKK